jgi:hypothetical protein
MPGSRIASFSHPWPKRIWLFAPETDSALDQIVAQGGVADATGFMVGDVHVSWLPSLVGTTAPSLGGPSPVIQDWVATPITDRQRPTGARGLCLPCSLPVTSDPAVAYYTTTSYDLPHAPPTRPTLHECGGMACSRFCGSSSEPDLIGDGAGLQDQWDPMEWVESILPPHVVLPGQPTMPSENQQESQGTATDFQIQAVDDFAPMPS